jgi:hypothetical protein
VTRALGACAPPTPTAITLAPTDDRATRLRRR